MKSFAELVALFGGLSNAHAGSISTPLSSPVTDEILSATVETRERTPFRAAPSRAISGAG